jgi:hypothetical protein
MDISTILPSSPCLPHARCSNPILFIMPIASPASETRKAEDQPRTTWCGSRLERNVQNSLPIDRNSSFAPGLRLRHTFVNPESVSTPLTRAFLFPRPALSNIALPIASHRIVPVSYRLTRTSLSCTRTRDVVKHCPKKGDTK